MFNVLGVVRKHMMGIIQMYFMSATFQKFFNSLSCEENRFLFLSELTSNSLSFQHNERKDMNIM